MAVHLVTWDLNREKPHYAQARATFIAQLGKFEHMKDPGLDSVWFVSTPWSAEQVSDFLRKALDDNDRIIVTQLHSGSHQGWLAKAVWDWIDARK
jgi:hypothetical protein